MRPVRLYMVFAPLVYVFPFEEFILAVTICAV